MLCPDFCLPPRFLWRACVEVLPASVSRVLTCDILFPLGVVPFRLTLSGRDLSPSNLLLAESPQGDAPPELKVADFGLSACCGGAFSSTGNENQGARSKGVCATIRKILNEASPRSVFQMRCRVVYVARALVVEVGSCRSNVDTTLRRAPRRDGERILYSQGRHLYGGKCCCHFSSRVLFR